MRIFEKKYNTMRITIPIILTILLILGPLFIETVIAQPPPPSPKEIPLDGGLGWLLAGGVAYGVKKLRDNHKYSRNKS